jgi:hypothetical protein
MSAHAFLSAYEKKVRELIFLAGMDKLHNLILAYFDKHSL